jgi:tRNA modification GTPase
LVALATAQGISAIAVIRLSGKNAIGITQRVFRGKRLENQASHTVHFGMIWDNDKPIDEAVVSIFRGPRSFTREDAVEISCHGSPVIAGKIIKVLLRKGRRPHQRRNR